MFALSHTCFFTCFFYSPLAQGKGLWWCDPVIGKWTLASHTTLPQNSHGTELSDFRNVNWSPPALASHPKSGNESIIFPSISLLLPSLLPLLLFPSPFLSLPSPSPSAFLLPNTLQSSFCSNYCRKSQHIHRGTGLQTLLH